MVFQFFEDKSVEYGLLSPNQNHPLSLTQLRLHRLRNMKTNKKVFIFSQFYMGKFFIISFAGPFTVSEAHSLGKSSGTGDVQTPSLRSDLTHF